MNTPDKLPSHIEALIARANAAQFTPPQQPEGIWQGLVDELGPEVTRATIGASVVVLSRGGLGALLASVAIGGALVGGVAVHVVGASTAQPTVAAPATAAPVVPAAPVVSDVPDVLVVPDVPARDVEPAPAVAAGRGRAPTLTAADDVAPAPVAAPPAAAADARDTDERLLIERARAALGRGDLEAAHAALALHTDAYPRGALVEDREALHVLRLYLAHDEGASRADATFRSLYPTSVYRAVLDRARRLDRPPAKDPQGASQSSP